MNKGDFWIAEHFSELGTKYAGKYVAVVNEKLVAVGDSGWESTFNMAVSTPFFAIDKELIS